MEPRTAKNATEASEFNRWRIWDTHMLRYAHIGYDTRATAKSAADKMNAATRGSIRYVVKRTAPKREEPKHPGGRPRGVEMPCGWGCGARLTARELRAHFTICPKRPKGVR